MNGLDIAILGVFFASVLIGALRGFTKELLSLFNWGGATSLSYIFLPFGQEFMHSYIANPVMAGGAAFLCMFVIFLIILSIIANIIAGYIHESSFRGIDHSLGFGFGILRGVVLISIVELGISVFWPRQVQSPIIQSARFIPMVRKGADILLQILPNRARWWVLEQAARVESQIHSKAQAHVKPSIPGMPREGGSQSASEEHVNPLQGGMESNNGAYGVAPSPSDSINQPLPYASHAAFPEVVTQQPVLQVPPQMVVIRPRQPGRHPQLAIDSGSSENGVASPPPMGLTQSVASRDRKSTVDQLSRLKPKALPQEDNGYTRGQRDDMNRLFQAIDGD